MRTLMEEKYNELLAFCNIQIIKNLEKINITIKKALNEFTANCKTPAIYCYGHHTKVLMADFIFELRKVHYIVDKNMFGIKESGFEIISDEQIEEKSIDGIIISSKFFREEIKENLEKNHSRIKYLDIYDALEREEIFLDKPYYTVEHPYKKYERITRLEGEILQEKELEQWEEKVKQSIAWYIEVKDFRSAISKTEQLINGKNSQWAQEVRNKLNELYSMQIEALEKIDDNNVLLLCIDGLRRKDVCEEHMEKLFHFIKQNMYYYNKAYSVSTSTNESLIPAYGEYTDMRTKYYESNMVKKGDCRFINKAKEQHRKICFYTDGFEFITDNDISVVPNSQTVTEKVWDFVLDATEEKNGLFLIHMLYESHYPYPSPYMKSNFIFNNSNILFEYLKKNGGKIEVDYEERHNESLRYLDDVIVGLLENLKCRVVMYADHGNIFLKPGTNLADIDKTYFTFTEELIQVPLAIKSPEQNVGSYDSVVSIMELNDIIISLLEKKKVYLDKKDYIRVARSEIYNPDLKYLYSKAQNERGILAFEAFLFENGYKLVIYADGEVELYETATDTKLENAELKKELFLRIKDSITVCERN